MAGREFLVKQRNRNNRKPRPLILIIAEGHNMTETKYFQQFQKQHAGYSIKVLTSGGFTDPKGLLEKLESYWNKNAMDNANGDRGFVVLDLDCDDKKGKLIKKLETGTKIAGFVISNPCFEVWYLLHFKYTTHAYLNGSEVIRDLKGYIPDYEKNKDVSLLLSSKTNTACMNAEKLSEHYEALGYKWPSNQENPKTDVPLILNIIKELGGDV